MYDLFLHGFLRIDLYKFISATYICLLLIVLLFSFITVFSIYRRRVERNKILWEQTITTILSQAIFFTNDDDEKVDITYRIEMLLKRSRFKDYLINELIQAKKNLSGSSILNLKKLYEVLVLDKHSYSKLSSIKWHIKAKGIQELSLMDQKKYGKEIFRLTNHNVELVRNEAQCALVCFYGFSGLRFLNVTTHPISQWQQIQLLNKLSDIHPENFEPLKKWLHSANDSVVEFALKIAAAFNCHEVYDDVISCLQSTNPHIRISALEYLKQVHGEESADIIIGHYNFENKLYKLGIINALKDIGSEKHVPFLLKQLHHIDNDIKAAAARSLASLHPEGIGVLQTHLFADEDPWLSIFLHIENDRAA